MYYFLGTKPTSTL